MDNNTRTIGGIEFEAIRQTRPTPHWRLKSLANGQIYASGTAGLDGSSRPKLWASLEDIHRRSSPRAFHETFALTDTESRTRLEAMREATRAKARCLPDVPECGYYRRLWDEQSQSGFEVRLVPAAPECREHYNVREFRDGAVVDFNNGSLAKCDTWVDFGAGLHRDWVAQQKAAAEAERRTDPAPA